MRLNKIALLGVAIILVSHVLLVDANKQREGKKDKEKGGDQKQRGGNKEERKQPPSSPAEKGKGRGSKGGKGSLQGKFVSKEKADCTWSVSGTETVALNVECIKGDTRLSCTFGGNPRACSNYAANEKSYWKQITRALRKQKNICQDQKAILKSKECKKGPPEAHLHFIAPSVPASGPEYPDQGQPIPTHKADPEKDSECAEDPDVLERQNMAKEYCGDKWSSLCTFFFSMVQSKTC
ncbi:fibroblast growth factor-binding protein 1 [Hyperolius riggenbachi]|uniref:fibroblast growth factor-binding protein 1 n=1 Tax=Hyperolius riggenbachi TaxID=752182 RepID=UPI0035A31317